MALFLIRDPVLSTNELPVHKAVAVKSNQDK
jgi:hypothetical protein